MVCDPCGTVLAVGRLQQIGDDGAQIRYMAVETGYQRQGLGTRILAQLEQAAVAAGCRQVLVHAREPALPFYRSRGYRLVEASHLLFGEIQHYLMTKQLAPRPAAVIAEQARPLS